MRVLGVVFPACFLCYFFSFFGRQVAALHGFLKLFEHFVGAAVLVVDVHIMHFVEQFVGGFLAFFAHLLQFGFPLFLFLKFLAVVFFQV